MSDRRAALEEERDFLLSSLADLEREHAAGDVDEHDYATLKADYTARAAAVLRSLESGRRRPVAATSSRRRRLGVAAAVLLLAVVAGAFVSQASGRRRGGTVTGMDVAAASAQVGECIALERSESDVDGAMDCYSEILDALPANVEALTFRGWLQVRSGDLEEGLADLDAAIQLSPSATSPYVFRASGRTRSGDAPGAISDLAQFFENEPDEAEAELARSLQGPIVESALDLCIAGEVSGSLDVVDVVECYRNVLAVDDGNPTASVYLGWLLARSGADDAAATELLDAGLAADPELSAGFVFRAALRAHLGDLEGARADLAAFDALDAPPDQASAAAEVRAAIDGGRDPLGR